MKFGYFAYTLCICIVCTYALSCNSKDKGPQQTNRYLFYPKPPLINLEGSVIKVDKGIMVLVQNTSLSKIPIVIIPANDSARATLKGSYDERIYNTYQISEKNWVKLAGTFIREDSLLPIFKYTWVEMLDSASEMKEVQEMEE